MCLCLSREVIVLLLLSCCDGINDQDKTVILLPLSSLHHISQRKEFIVSSIEKQSRSFQCWVDKTPQDGWGNERNGLSELFQRNERVRAIFFYYLDIIQWSNTLPLDQKSSQASSKTHSSPYIWINTGSGLQRILDVREGENHSLSLNGL